MGERSYICIDLKSFYASVECVERGLDPMTTKLVVADPERSEKTICLAITPAMKALGIPNRCRMFQIPEGIDYIVAPPRMSLYIDYAAEIYGVYLKYIAKEDIHVYSIDEAFLDVTEYLTMYQLSPKALGMRMMEDIFKTTGITSSCGIGTNLYLAKIALDITAKHAEDHIGILDEEAYRRTLWDHKPLTDFWRVGAGIARRLERCGITTQRQIAEVDEELLYRMFGIDAELLIDHAWGRETATIADIKAFVPKNHSISSGQVLSRDYAHEEGKLIVREMADLMCLDLVDQGLIAHSIFLQLGFSNALGVDAVRGTTRLLSATSSPRAIIPETEKLYDRIKDKNLPLRRVTLAFQNLVEEVYQQYDLFMDPEEMERERNMQRTVLRIKDKYGKNALVKGMNLEAGATTIERNQQIGGHRSGE